MIEQCDYCNLVHDTGDASATFDGSTIKTCPMVDPVASKIKRIDQVIVEITWSELKQEMLEYGVKDSDIVRLGSGWAVQKDEEFVL